MAIAFYLLYWFYLPVFFMTDVKLLRMELIFARSTLARFGKANAGEGDRREVFTGFGRGGVAVMVGTGVHEEAFEMLSVGFVDTEVDTADFSTGFSFLSSTVQIKKRDITSYYFPDSASNMREYALVFPDLGVKVLYFKEKPVTS